MTGELKVIGIFIDPLQRPDTCNFIHRETEDYSVPAVCEVRFQLSGNYATVLRMCDAHLREMVNVDGPA